MHITNFNTYILHSLKIFFLAFTIGKSIDNIFITIQKKYEKVNNLLFGLLHVPCDQIQCSAVCLQVRYVYKVMAIYISFLLF